VPPMAYELEGVSKSFRTSTRGRARARHGVLLGPKMVKQLEEEMSHGTWKAGDRRPDGRPRRKDRPRCNARIRAGGACLVRAEPDKARCRFHGGLSTGPRTEEGRARIAATQRRRWRAYRANSPNELAWADRLVLTHRRPLVRLLDSQLPP